MQQRYFYEYAVIRVVPKVEREEFLNVGVILFCKEARFLKAHCQLDEARLNLFSSELQLDEVRENLLAFDKICKGTKDGGAMALEDHASRFRWLTAVRSSSIQTSRPHHGFSTDLEKTLQRLFEELVT